MRSILFLFILAVAIPVSAQIKTFKWQSELCDLSGTYDAKKYTPAQLRNTLTLFGANAPRIDFSAAVWRYDEIAGLDLAALDREYEQKSKIIRDLNIVKVPFWERLRQAELKEMQEYYELSKITAQAYTDPNVINSYPRAESCKMKYAGPLIAGGEKLIEAWRRVNLDSQKRNADPKRLQDIWDQQNASPDRLKYARVETMAFGWWNCANALLPHDDAANDGTADAEYKKLFKRVRQRCDEA
ncbi:MAG: hypothetical protein IT173_03420 [Acidobacteria bacterium]|nr:hypothetical protein [Acidobacteriota bacterium]